MAPHKTTTEVYGQREQIDFKGLEPLLRRSFGDESLQVVHFDSTRLLPAGENYCSIMIKLDVLVRQDNEEKMLHLVAKTPNPADNAVIEWPIVFKKELFMYVELCPLYRELDRESLIEECEVINIWPKYIGYRNSLQGGDKIDYDSSMLLENLKHHGFYTFDKRQGLDVEHARKALTSLAKYHALGIAMKQKRPAMAKKAITQARVLGIDFVHMNDGYDNVMQTFQEEPALQTHMSAIESCFEQAKDGKPYKEMPIEPWATITHGDFWVNNMLFHKDEARNVDDVKFIDFQTYLYSSPLKDLPYFFSGSLNKSAQTRYLKELIDVYYKTFIKTLKRTGCDFSLFTRSSFDRELKKQAIIQFPISALTCKFLVSDVETYGDESNERVLNNVFNTKASDAFINKLHALIEMYEEMRWF
ncbi:uncharacterized protein LOC131664586 [Phymastichus coffea]|uniref:uncharacterized protein LOC131664586 n=1 Tax=Phymastichus coffea TaxID=108790 RepID=UPI00273B9E76|nr:uncharacterized protein LOC131664586 [Phymastichus coffea]XP_058791786.1 uncharacterized protein LOC131664586 [Phymastichus coffea]XP_058791788.1 uncharacterized protein LOC131664586 [Phymastichus coffea]